MALRLTVTRDHAFVAGSREAGEAVEKVTKYESGLAEVDMDSIIKGAANPEATSGSGLSWPSHCVTNTMDAVAAELGDLAG